MKKIDFKSIPHIINNTSYIFKILWKTDKTAFFIQTLIGFAARIVEPIAILFSKLLIDNISNEKSMIFVVVILAIYTVMQIIPTLTMNWQNWVYSPKITLKFKNKINRILLNKMKDLDAECFDKSEFYDKYTRAINEAESRGMSVFDVATSSVGIIITLIFTICTISILDPLIFIFSLLSLLMQLRFNISFNKLNYAENTANTNPNRKVGYIKRIFYQPQFVKDLKMNGKITDVFLSKYDSANEELKNNIDKFGNKRRKMYNRLGIFGMTAIHVLIMLYLCYKVIYSGMTLGTFVALQSFSATFAGQLEGFFGLITRTHQNSLFIDNLREILDYSSHVENFDGDKLPAGQAPEIKFDNVSFSYFNGADCALKNVSFSLNKGEKLAIVGYNGAGKSTLVKLLCRLYNCTGGNIYINERNINEYETPSYRNNISCVFQDYNIYGLTVSENILSKSGITQVEEALVWKALSATEIDKTISAYPNGINTILSTEFEGGVALSGGEQQKIAIAQAIVKDAGLLIFDEPSSSLDPEAEDKIYKNIMKLAQNKTTIYISHRLANTSWADKIILMDNGEIKEMGTHSELMKLNQVYAYLYKLQMDSYVSDQNKDDDK